MGLAGFGCAAGPMSPVSLLLRRITWGERPGSCSASFVTTAPSSISEPLSSPWESSALSPLLLSFLSSVSLTWSRGDVCEGVSSASSSFFLGCGCDCCCSSSVPGPRECAGELFFGALLGLAGTDFFSLSSPVEEIVCVTSSSFSSLLFPSTE